jgi:uncharacterized glyoxalase superfamily protein PhnB
MGNTHRPQLGGTTPLLRIFDEAKAKEFYVEFLDFKIDWEHRFEDSLPLYMQVSRDGCVIHLTGHFGDGCPGASVRIDTKALKELSTALVAKNCKHARPGYEKADWQTVEMTIKDPFGNSLTFAERLHGNTKD